MLHKSCTSYLIRDNNTYRQLTAGRGIKWDDSALWRIVDACQDTSPFLNEATWVIQAKLLKVSEEGSHSLWMAGRATRQNRDLSQAGQNTGSQNMGMDKEWSEHGGRQLHGHWTWM